MFAQLCAGPGVPEVVEFIEIEGGLCKRLLQKSQNDLYRNRTGTSGFDHPRRYGLLSKAPLQSIKIVALDLGALALGLAAANFPLDLQRPVSRPLARHLDAEPIIGAIAAAETAERIELFGVLPGLGAALAPVRARLALLLLLARGFLGKRLRALAQPVERARLAVNCGIEIAVA